MPVSAHYLDLQQHASVQARYVGNFAAAYVLFLLLPHVCFCSCTCAAGTGMRTALLPWYSEAGCSALGR